MKLSIVIPHYKEPFEIINKLLMSIDNQRLIARETIEVLIINDCGTPLKAKEKEKLVKHLIDIYFKRI